MRLLEADYQEWPWCLSPVANTSNPSLNYTEACGTALPNLLEASQI